VTEKTIVGLIRKGGKPQIFQVASQEDGSWVPSRRSGGLSELKKRLWVGWVDDVVGGVFGEMWWGFGGKRGDRKNKGGGRGENKRRGIMNGWEALASPWGDSLYQQYREAELIKSRPRGRQIGNLSKKNEHGGRMEKGPSLRWIKGAGVLIIHKCKTKFCFEGRGSSINTRVWCADRGGISTDQTK